MRVLNKIILQGKLTANLTHAYSYIDRLWFPAC